MSFWNDLKKSGQEAAGKAKDLAERFRKNFKKYEGNEIGRALVAAGPQI